MKVLCSIILSTCFLIPPSLNAETYVRGGYVSGTWTLNGSPYFLLSDCTIHSDSSLIIEPGVDVFLRAFTRLEIQGQLLAEGTESDSIVFTAYDTTLGSSSLDFVDTDFSSMDSSKLVYCEISYGVAGRWLHDDMHGGGLFIQNSSRLLISHCLIVHNHTRSFTGQNGEDYGYGGDGGDGECVTTGHGGAIYCESSNPLIEYSQISYNFTGDATGGTGGLGEDFENLIVPLGVWGGDGGNGGYGYSGKGGAIYFLNCDAITVENSLFSFNNTGIGHGSHGGDGGEATNYYQAWGGWGGFGGEGRGGAGGAFYLQNSSGLLAGNLIYSNSTGMGIGDYGGDGGNAYTAGGSAYAGPGRNGGKGRGGNGSAVYLDSSDIQMYNCLIFQNKTGGGTGGDGGLEGSTGTIWPDDIGNVNAEIMKPSRPDNSDNGGRGGDGIGGSGYAVYSGPESSIAIDNCTIANHTLLSIGEGGSGGGGYGGGSGTSVNGSHIIYGQNVTISNSIIWDNASPLIDSTNTVNYTCIEGGFSGFGNFETDPLFTNAIEGSFYLSQIAAGQAQQSPCVDAGDPSAPLINGTTRTDGYPDEGILDLGFHYSQGEQSGIASNSGKPIDQEDIRDNETLTGEEETIADLSIPEDYCFCKGYPNPFNASIVLKFGLPDASLVNLSIYDAMGRFIWKIVESQYQPGYHSVIFEGRGLPSGIYFARLTAGNFTQTQKLVLLK